MKRRRLGIEGHSKRIKEMATFYASNSCLWVQRPEAWLDASKKRWPNATQRDRVLAHRLAETMISNTENKRFEVVAGP